MQSDIFLSLKKLTAKDTIIELIELICPVKNLDMILKRKFAKGMSLYWDLKI